VNSQQLQRQVSVLTSVHRPFDQRIFHKECRSLAECGYQVTLVAPADFDERIRHGVRVLGVERPRSRLARPIVWWELLRKAIRSRPDVVHIHDPELLLIAPFIQLALGTNLRIVYDVHEYFVDSIAHKVWIPTRLRRPVAWMAQRIERLLGMTVDGLVFAVEEQAPFYSGWKAKRVVIHNYPRRDAFRGAEPICDIPRDRFRLIYVGSLYARRGIMTMLRALSQIVPHVPEVLLILGGSFESEEFRRRIESFIARQHLETHVNYVGWVDHEKLKNYLASADVAWLPGLRVEQYRHRAISTKQLECMLMGLPIVSSDHPHRRFFIDQADCGLSVTSDDPAAHAEALLWLYRHPGERKAMGERGRQLVLEGYTWETEASSLSDFYRHLLSEQRNHESI